MWAYYRTGFVWIEIRMEKGDESIEQHITFFYKMQEAGRIVSVWVLYNTTDGCCLPPLEIQLTLGHFKGIDVPQVTFSSGLVEK